MNFAPPVRPRAARENIVPMINVVFLLLIFFLISAQIAPPDPFDVAPPELNNGAPGGSQDVLYIAADGRLAFNEARNEAVFDALRSLPEETTLAIRADAALPAAVLAALLPRLAEAGQTDIELLTVPQP